jgi:hypothetical protein
MIRIIRILLLITVFGGCICNTGAAESLFTPNSLATPKYSITQAYTILGDSFKYETGYGRVAVKAKGTLSGFGVRLSPIVDVGYKYMDFDVDSYFADTQVGKMSVRTNLFTMKAVIKTDGTSKQCSRKTGARYGFLDNNGIPGIHNVELFRSIEGKTLDAAYGVSAFFGTGMDSEFGGFANLSYHPDESVALFAEYSSVDFLKMFQNEIVARSAANVGVIDTSNAPKDAFSFGLRIRAQKNLSLKFAVYDFNLQMKPFVEASFSR